MKHFRTPPTPTPDSDWESTHEQGFEDGYFDDLDDEDDDGFDDDWTLGDIAYDRAESEASRRYQQSREEGP